MIINCKEYLRLLKAIIIAILYIYIYIYIYIAIIIALEFKGQSHQGKTRVSKEMVFPGKSWEIILETGTDVLGILKMTFLVTLQ